MPARKLNPAQVAAKCVEVEKCFISTESGFFEADLERTLSVGDLARVSANIRQAGVVDTNRLSAIAVATKIPYRTLRDILLPELENLGWGQIRRDKTGVVAFEESIPPGTQILATLGQVWEERQPSPVDRATIDALGLLSDRPIVRSALSSEVGQEEQFVTRALDYGLQVRYFGSFHSAELNDEVAWSPFYWATRESDVRTFLGKRSETEFDALRAILQNVRGYPGRPVDRLTLDSQTKGIVNGGIATGFLPSVGIRDRSGQNHSYAFAPVAQFGSEETADVFERARMIVACIRHGQWDWEVTPIRKPRALLRSLVDGRIRSHSYADIEYATLVVHRICDLELDTSHGGRRYRPIFIDTPENHAAATLAEQLLGGEDVSSASVAEPEVQRLLTSGVFGYTAEERIVRSKSRIIAAQPFERMLEQLRGGPIR